MNTFTMPTTGGDVHVYRDGPADAPALLLIHGSAASGRWWEPQIPALAEEHHVIRVDLLGCGRSSKPDDGDYTVPAQGRRVAEVLDRLDVPRALVIGHSSGGYTATALAEQRPDLVTGLVLISAGPHMGAYIAPNIAIGPDDWPPSPEQVRRLASTAFGRPDFPIPRDLIDELRNVGFGVFATIMSTPRDYLAERGIPDRLAEVDKPLLVIFGAGDRRWDPASAADYSVVPGVAIQVLPGVGHSPNVEDPARVNPLLLEFAAELDGHGS